MLRVNVLGGLAVERDGTRLEGAAAQPRRLALLALLTTAGAKGLGRDRILALLWPDADEERGRKNLAQSVYALRQVMGEDALLAGPWDIRLNSEQVGSDLQDFRSARESGALDRAAALWTGPFLDGFVLAGAPEFERWTEERRTDLRHEYCEVLERLAREAKANPRAAVDWWRRRAALDPFDGRASASLMRAMIAAGDPGAALQHGRAFQAALAGQLSLPPDREVEAVLAGLRSFAAPVASAAPAVPPLVAPAPAAPAPAAVPESALASRGPQSLRAPSRRRVAVVAAVVFGVVVAAALIWRLAGRETPTLSIGRLTDYRPEPREELRGPLVDLLATALARTASLRVVSTARMYELLGAHASDESVPVSTWAEAARRAGASQLIDGALYQLPDGRLRLDLRRLDLENGRVLGSARAQATDAFSLADSASGLLVAGLGLEPPRGSIASLTTTSIAAYRLYEQGLRANFRRDYSTALELFTEALREDSTFAMAALYAGRASREWPHRVDFIQRANRMALRASERERLLIRAQAAVIFSDPALSVYIDSLVSRFPGEVEGYLYAGIARAGAGDYLQALPYLERVVQLDSTLLDEPAAGECRICDALQYIIGSHHALDSLDTAIEMARRATRLLPQWPNGWAHLSDLLSIRGDYQEAEAAAINFDRYSPGVNLATRTRAMNLIRAGRPLEAARMLAEEAAMAAGERRMEALWFQALALRDAARADEAVAVARRYRSEFTGVGGLGASSGPMLHGMTLDLAGRGREAAALFDSIAAVAFAGENVSHTSRTRAWAKTHAATALFSVGDTARLAGLADTVREFGVRSGFGRDQRLHHHVRGLLYAARGQDSLALAELHAAVFTPNLGYTRTNLEAARIHLRRGEFREAIALLEPALRGSLEASNMYVSRAAIHQLLAEAWQRAGDAGRAARHRRMAEGRGDLPATPPGA